MWLLLRVNIMAVHQHKLVLKERKQIIQNIPHYTFLATFEWCEQAVSRISTYHQLLAWYIIFRVTFCAQNSQYPSSFSLFDLHHLLGETSGQYCGEHKPKSWSREAKTDKLKGHWNELYRQSQVVMSAGSSLRATPFMSFISQNENLKHSCFKERVRLRILKLPLKAVVETDLTCSFLQCTSRSPLWYSCHTHERINVPNINSEGSQLFSAAPHPSTGPQRGGASRRSLID